jgi:hypothetical protein
MRFDCDRVEQERERIAELFQQCERALRHRKPLFDRQLFDDFAAFVIETVKRMQVASGAQWVEFLLKVRGEQMRIAVEPSPQRGRLLSAVSP